MMNKAGMVKGLFIVALCLTMMCTACSTAWIGEAEQIVAALIPATTNLVALAAALDGKNVSAADLQTIQSAGAQAGAGLELMQSLIMQYQKADAASQPGLLNQIQAAMSAVQSTLNGLLQALHIKDAATQAKISAVVGILIAEVQSVAAIVPLIDPSASLEEKTAATRQTKKHPPLTASEFVISYNSTITAKTGNSELDRAASKSRIHLHGKAERWASAGWLK